MDKTNVVTANASINRSIKLTNIAKDSMLLVYLNIRDHTTLTTRLTVELFGR